MSNHTIGKRIKRLRKSKGLNQAELGELIGKSNGAISQYELGQTDIPTSVLVKLAEALGVSYEWLMSEEPLPDESFRRSISIGRLKGDSNAIGDYNTTGNTSQGCEQQLAMLQVKYDALQGQCDSLTRERDVYKEQVEFLKNLLGKA